jgi:hypothetical protein
VGGSFEIIGIKPEPACGVARNFKMNDQAWKTDGSCFLSIYFINSYLLAWNMLA